MSLGAFIKQRRKERKELLAAAIETAVVTKVSKRYYSQSLQERAAQAYIDLLRMYKRHNSDVSTQDLSFEAKVHLLHDTLEWQDICPDFGHLYKSIVEDDQKKIEKIKKFKKKLAINNS
jgi:hypothetical protein